MKIRCPNEKERREEAMRLTNRYDALSQIDYKYEIFVEHFVFFSSKVKNYTKFQTRMCQNCLLKLKYNNANIYLYSLDDFLVNILNKNSNSFDSLLAIVANNDHKSGDKTSNDQSNRPNAHSKLSHTYVTDTNGTQVSFNDSCSIYNHFRVCQNEGICKLNENLEPSCL